MRSRARLRSQAAIVPRRDAFSGSTFDARNTSSRRPAIASPTSSSTAPEPYISAVSTWVMPASSPRRSAAIAAARSCSISQVPWPITATGRCVGPNDRAFASLRARFEHSLSPENLMVVDVDRLLLPPRLTAIMMPSPSAITTPIAVQVPPIWARMPACQSAATIPASMIR